MYACGGYPCFANISFSICYAVSSSFLVTFLDTYVLVWGISFTNFFYPYVYIFVFVIRFNFIAISVVVCYDHKNETVHTILIYIAFVSSAFARLVSYPG